MFEKRLETLKKYFRIYWLYFSQYWKARLVYKSDFLLGSFGQLVSVGVSLAFLTLVFTQIDSLQGWSFNEMLFLSGFGGLIVFTHNVFLYNVTRVGEDYIVKGDMDRFLLRPLNPLFQIYSDDIRDNNLPKILANAALIVYSSIQIGLDLSILKVVYASATLVSGLLTIGAIYLLFSSTAFWTGTSRSAVWLVFRLSDFRKYPIGIFGVIIQTLLVTLVPLGLAIFFPTTYILGKPGWGSWQILSIFAGPILYLMAYKFWKFGLTRYSSTGS